MSHLYTQSFLEELECPVCTEYMHPPIRQCTRGHCICSNCYTRLERCPTCRNDLTMARCFVLEQLHSKLYFPCKNKGDGCTFISSGGVIKKHEENCVHSTRECPLIALNDCEWQGQFKDVVEHCKSRHPFNIYVTNKQKLTCMNFLRPTERTYAFYIIFEAYGELFKCTLSIDYTSKIMKWCVFYLGQKELTSRFSYQIELENKKKLYQKLCLKAPCEAVIPNEELESFSNYLLLNCDMVKPYCSGKDLIYTVTINKK